MERPYTFLANNTNKGEGSRPILSINRFIPLNAGFVLLFGDVDDFAGFDTALGEVHLFVGEVRILGDEDDFIRFSTALRYIHDLISHVFVGGDVNKWHTTLLK
jgi:hypothetical protein